MKNLKLARKKNTQFLGNDVNAEQLIKAGLIKKLKLKQTGDDSQYGRKWKWLMNAQEKKKEFHTCFAKI